MGSSPHFIDERPVCRMAAIRRARPDSGLAVSPHSDKAAKKNPPTEADGLFSSYYAASRDGPRQQSRKLKRCSHSYLRPSIGAVTRWQQAA